MDRSSGLVVNKKIDGEEVLFSFIDLNFKTTPSSSQLLDRNWNETAQLVH